MKLKTFLPLLALLLVPSLSSGQIVITPPAPGAIPGTIIGGTCTNQAVTSISATGVPTCTTLTAAYITSPGANTQVLFNDSNVIAGDLSLTWDKTSNVLVVDGNVGITTTSPDGPLDVVKSAIVTTSTDGLIVQNETAATGAVTVQMSPRIRLRGTAWDTSASQTLDFFSEVLPASAATPTALYKIGFSLNGGAATYPLTLTSGDSTGGTLNVRDINVTSTGAFGFTSRSTIKAPNDALFNLTNNAETVGIQFNVGTATPTFNNGTVTTGSRNVSGQITLTGGNTSGTLTFGSPAWTNAPFCQVTGSASTDLPHITASSTTAITIAGMTANGIFTYLCVGRV